MKALLIKICQPTAHYRMPFSYQRRHTYPIPPYSTVIGFLCNMMGINHQENEWYKELKNCKLSISGKFDQKLTEYIWFRNLSKKSHEQYFGSIEVREKNGEINHMGGQSPMRIDVLENIQLNIHIAGDLNFLSKLEIYLRNPVNRLETVHLGRAEDCLVFESIRIVDLIPSKKDKNYNHFFWIPQQIWLQYEMNFNFDSAEGLFYNLPVFLQLEITNRHTIIMLNEISLIFAQN